MEFSVIDIETTGFSKSYDRIIELAIIRINESGNVIDTYETLINPERDVGPSHIHGISASDVINAPKFDVISKQLIPIIDNSILVSHNKAFDLGFLTREFQRLDKSFPDFYGICTLNLSKVLFPELPSRKLKILCEYLDILVENAHVAYEDCLATSQLFTKMYETYCFDYGKQNFYESFIVGNKFIAPKKVVLNKKIKFKRSDAKISKQKNDSQIKELLNRIPDTYKSSEYNISEYLNLLDRILEDRLITKEEITEIESYANIHEISSANLVKIHGEYFRRLVRFYLSDKILSNAEILDLEKVGDLLQINRDEQNMIIELEKAELDLNKQESSVNLENFKDKSICFTGQLLSKINGVIISRETAHSLALEKGMIVRKGVTKKLDYLIVADPNTQSGKATKARKYGIKILAEPVFWKEIGIKIE